MGKMSPAGRVPKMGGRQDTAPHQANPKMGKPTTTKDTSHPVSKVQKGGAVGKAQHGQPGAPTQDVANGGSSRGRVSGPFNHDGAGAAGNPMSGTFPAMDVGGSAQDGGRAGGFR